MTKKIEYVSMLMFSQSMQECVLIEKNRPAFLAGKLCPVGGHKEIDESSIDAAIREFFEEVNISTSACDWKLYAVCVGDDWTMDCFCSASPLFSQAKTATDETVKIMPVTDALILGVISPRKVAPDLIALIGLAMQSQSRDCVTTIDHNSIPKKPALRP
jgi:8-oxo-dGTP pyrophosphatase MutT (NUDIX family)